MYKYKFSLVYKILVYPITVEAIDENEAQTLFTDTMAIKMFPTNTEIDELGEAFYASWNIDAIETFCANCGEAPEWIEGDVEDYTVCPSGCYIAH